MDEPFGGGFHQVLRTQSDYPGLYGTADHIAGINTAALGTGQWSNQVPNVVLTHAIAAQPLELDTHVLQSGNCIGGAVDVLLDQSTVFIPLGRLHVLAMGFIPGQRVHIQRDA